MKVLYFLLALVFLSSCSKDETLAASELKGTYEGWFYRTAPNVDYMRANITLTLTGDKFSGLSNLSRYPVICSGTYKAGEGKLNVQNACVFTADFDWSLIFNGEYNYSVSRDELRIWREYPGKVFDNYVLKLKEEK